MRRLLRRVIFAGPSVAGLILATLFLLRVASNRLHTARAQAATRPDVVLVTLDTTRADRMGFLGSTRGLTPQLDALARTSVVFTHAYSQSPVTTVSHATILSGTYPFLHHVTDFGFPLPATVPYLPDLFRRQGYRTAAFVGSLILDPRNGTAPGFDRGFDEYDAGYRLRRPGEDRYRTLERRGDEVVTRTLGWLGSKGAGASSGPRQPYFLWVHLNDPHDPYDPPADLTRRFAAAPYDGEIAAVDRAVGRLLGILGPDTLIVIAADHGEALGDHGEATHGVFLYDVTLHVPLMMRLPDKRGAGVRIAARVRLADVAPTMLESAGLPVPGAMEGETLLPLIGPDAQSRDRPVYAETEYPLRAFGWSPLVSWRADRFLFIRAPKRELYDLVTDPSEARNLAGLRARVADGLQAELAKFLSSAAGVDGRSRADPKRPGAVPPVPDAALAERLAALGYVTSGGVPNSSGIDPKDRIGIANALHEAVLAVEDGSYRKAIPLLETVTTSDPNIPIAQLNLGVARARSRRYPAAVTALKKAVALQPDVMIAHYELALALYETGDLKTSAAHFEIVAQRMPKWADARYSLGSVYARINRVPDSLVELRTAIQLEPRHFRANLLLGRILTLQGDGAGAVPYLQTAIDMNPSTAEAHEFLADALEKIGRSADAARERHLAVELKSK